MTTSQKSLLVSMLAVSLSLVQFSHTVSAQSYSAAQNFSVANNPNGAWKYGYSYGAGSPFILDTTNTPAYAGLALGGWLGNVDSAGGAGYPYVLRNSTGSPVANNVTTVYQPGQIGLQPGSSNEDTVVRWTAPFSATFSINATFSGLSSIGDSADVHIFLNGISIFSSVVSPTAVSYSTSGNLSAGDILDFVVGNDGNGFNNDTTALSATIVPEPAVAGLVLTGLASLLSVRFFKGK